MVMSAESAYFYPGNSYKRGVRHTDTITCEERSQTEAILVICTSLFVALVFF